jgi:hypothetical protein
MGQPIDDDKPRLLAVGAAVAPAPDKHRLRQKRALYRMAAGIARFCVSFFVTDASRLKRAYIRNAEARADERMAQARKTVAEAMEIHAKAESKRQEAALARLKAAEQLEEKGHAREAEAIRQFSVALSRVEDAIGLIRQAGGDVHLDHREILRLVGLGRKLSPDDHFLRCLIDESGPEQDDPPSG